MDPMSCFQALLFSSTKQNTQVDMVPGRWATYSPGVMRTLTNCCPAYLLFPLQMARLQVLAPSGQHLRLNSLDFLAYWQEAGV